METLKTLTIKFDNFISHTEIPKFRGAVVKLLGDDVNLLFHNHTLEGLRYSYPLIQYKILDGKFAIVCIGEGTEIISDFFNKESKKVTVNKRERVLEIEEIKAERTLIQLHDCEFEYIIKKWMPFNHENYQKYMELDSLVERYQMLEQILVANILSLLKGVGVYLEDTLKCRVTNVLNSNIGIYKGVKMMQFDIKFKTNLLLPSYVGIGKGVSIGHGTIIKQTEKQ